MFINNFILGETQILSFQDMVELNFVGEWGRFVELMQFRRLVQCGSGSGLHLSHVAKATFQKAREIRSAMC